MHARVLQVCLTVGLSVLASNGLAAPDWFAEHGASPPKGARVYICHGYTCRIVTPVTLTAAELDAISAPFKSELADAGAERQAISEAVQSFEEIVGKRVGTGADLPGMQFGSNRPDQMDCIDEATNTTSLLMLLAHHGYLRHHRVLRPSGRGFFLDGRYPHATAVVAESAGGTKWAVDSWPRANAEPPLIQLLSQWRRSRTGALPS
jgi:hypothetical protein